MNERDSAPQEPGQVPASEWEIWDSKRSLFDNHTSETFEKNVEYMYKSFGFHFPDWEYLRDPEGLLQCATRSPVLPDTCCSVGSSSAPSIFVAFSSGPASSVFVCLLFTVVTIFSLYVNQPGWHLDRNIFAAVFHLCVSLAGIWVQSCSMGASRCTSVDWQRTLVGLAACMQCSAT